MQPFFGLAQIIGRAPRNDFFAVLDEGLERFLEVEQLGLAIDNRQHVDAEGFLERGMFVELVEHDLRYGIALELDRDAHAFTVGFIARFSGDSFNLFFLVQQSNLLDQAGFVDHVGNFADDDLLFPRALDRFDKRLAAHLDDTLAFLIGLNDRFLAVDETTRWEIRSGDVAYKLFDGDVRIFYESHQSLDNLVQIVRRNIGGHAHRDTRGAIHEKIGNTRG